MQDNSARIIVADCVKYLKTLSENSLDSCVCDPPYGLEFMGKEWDRLWGGKQEDNPDGFTGSDGVRRSKTNPVSAILGRPPVYEAGTAAQAWHLRWATEVFRVLKPGGHLLAFGGTRTYHRLACAVEDAGFEIRDTINWVYASGFPKSHDVSKTIDAGAGAERTIVGIDTSRRRPNRTGAVMGEVPYDRSDNGATITAPATPEGIKWAGWGTALKPAHEPILVARKPLIGTVAENVLKFGTGALNIDATRIWAGGEPHYGALERHPNAIYGGGKGTSVGPILPASVLGRWPPNLVLTHSPECVKAGWTATKRAVRTFEARENDSIIYGGGKGTEGSGMKSGADVLEEMESWSCAPGCPVAEMDRQSGDVPSSVYPEYTQDSQIYGAGKGLSPKRGGRGYNDDGGASRFFPTFSWHTEEVSFIYEPKASRSEREAGLDSEIEGENGLSYKTSGYRCRKCGKWKVSGNPCTCPEPDFEPQSFARPNVANNHPTVKPIALLRWLTRLVTPPGGTVMDPFSGSGSEGCAAVIEGFNYIGIERDPGYAEIAKKRIAYWSTMPKSQAPSNLLAGSRAPSVTLDSFSE